MQRMLDRIVHNNVYLLLAGTQVVAEERSGSGSGWCSEHARGRILPREGTLLGIVEQTRMR